jgi:adenosylmethionine-8-amino-7-oxononanoate aminotransferase
VLALKNSYHGDTFGAMSVSDRGIFTLAFQDKLFEVIFIDPADLQKIAKSVLHPPPVSDSRLPTQDSRLAFHPEQIACFIYEPLIQGAGGMKIYEAEQLNQLLKTLKAHGIICIADEVMTGFGRTGNLFASSYMDEKPDIICLSKGLTGGTMAMGVTACSKKIHDAFVSDDKLKTFFHGHSYTANPLACTAALASLDLLLDQSCLQNIERINQQHQEFVAQLQTTNNKQQTKNHRCLGTIVAFEIETGKDDYLNNISTTITRRALSKGVFIRPLGNTVYIMPPYCITESELQKIYEVIIEILNEA